ncbi:MAG TPA: amidohydrolase family protein [Xanthobacteraceae bacterium]|jgi:cytosine deaminase
MQRSHGITIERVVLADRAGVYSLSLRDGTVAGIKQGEDGEARWLALPGLANLHAHADRSYAVELFRPRSFADAVAAATAGRAGFTSGDVEKRATRFFESSISHGVTRLRTHTDIDPIVDLRCMQGVLAAKCAVAPRLDVDVVAFSTSRNDLAEPHAVELLERAVELGADFLGASLNASSDAPRALDTLFTLAERSNLPVDLHLDEHMEPGRTLAPMVAEAVIARGLQGRVTFSHLCVLSALEADPARGLIDKIAAADITVIALPETNLLLQDRVDGSPRRRGLTLVRELLAAGVKLRLGSDNVRDWFYPFGDGDMLDTARLAVIAAHLDDTAELVGAICDGRHAIEERAPADLVLIPACSLDDALARRPAGRIVFKSGRQVAGPLL